MDYIGVFSSRFKQFFFASRIFISNIRHLILQVTTIRRVCAYLWRWRDSTVFPTRTERTAGEEWERNQIEWRVLTSSVEWRHVHNVTESSCNRSTLRRHTIATSSDVIEWRLVWRQDCPTRNNKQLIKNNQPEKWRFVNTHFSYLVESVMFQSVTQYTFCFACTVV